jgi:hypothetical protein
MKVKEGIDLSIGPDMEIGREEISYNDKSKHGG